MALKGLITILACAALFAGLAVPLILRKVPRNSAYGFRTRKTLGDDAIWYEANAHFGRGLLAASLVTAAAMAVLYRLPGLPPGLFMKASVAILVVPVLAAALLTARFVRTL